MQRSQFDYFRYGIILSNFIQHFAGWNRQRSEYHTDAIKRIQFACETCRLIDQNCFTSLVNLVLQIFGNLLFSTTFQKSCDAMWSTSKLPGKQYFFFFYKVERLSSFILWWWEVKYLFKCFIIFTSSILFKSAVTSSTSSENLRAIVLLSHFIVY